MISTILIGLIFAIAFIVTIQYGWEWTFVAVYLPTLILLNQLPQIEVPHLPIAAQFAPLYAILLGMPFRSERFRFKICSVDIIFILLLVSAAITAWTTEVFETVVNILRTDFLTLSAPYFLARVVFSKWEMRRAGLNVLIGIVAIISVCALIEVRMVPYFYLHMLQALGMNNKIQTMAYNRFHFYRVSGPVEHPIYFGNMCVVLLGMVAVLAKTSGLSLKNGWVATALFACMGCVITSISYTPYIGCIAGMAALLTMISLPYTRRLIFPMTVLVVIGMFGYTYYTATRPLGDKPVNDEFGGSLYIRRVIISESWKKAEHAGPFGYGIRPEFEEDQDFDLKSIDNSYMQFTLTHGWVYTILWISIGLCFAWRVTSAFRHITHPSQVFPLAVATATVLGLMVSMYTVWAGALYTVIWGIMLGLSNTLIDSVKAAAIQPRRVLVPVTGPFGPFDYASDRSGGPAIAY